MKNVLKKISSIINVIFVIIIISLIYQKINDETPNIFGYSLFVVQTGSMEPVINVGDVIVCKTVDPEDVEVDDIITYQGLDGTFAGKVITHVVVEEPYYEDGLWHYQTRGIYEDATNDPLIDETQLIGVYCFEVVPLTFISNALSTQLGILLIVTIPFSVLIINQIIKLSKSIKEEGEENAGNKNI